MSEPANVTKAAKIIPVTDDGDTAPFFEGARLGELRVRQCSDCSNGIHPPMARCPFCGSWKTAWRAVSGSGRLHTWTTVAHTLHPAYPAPYTLVSVELDDVPRVRLIGRLAGEPELQPGLPMQVFFEEHEDGVVLPNWKPASGS